MDDEVFMAEHIDLLSVIKDKLNEIPADKLIRWNSDGEIDNAQFVFLQFLKETIRQDGAKWIRQYTDADYHGAV